MATTTDNYYRALMGDFGVFRIREARANDTVERIYPGDGILYPRWVAKGRTDREGKPVMREGKQIIDQADVRFSTGEDGIPMVQTRGGTSLHNVPKWFGAKEFWIPVGTEYSDQIYIRIDPEKAHPTKEGVRGRHAQLEVSKPMTQTTFQGYLDVMARNAVARQIALAKEKVRG